MEGGEGLVSSINREVAEMKVEMEFDRKNFAEGVKDTLKDLDTLEKSMSFKGGVQGIRDLQSAANHIDFSGLTNNVQSISNSLNYMKSFAFKVFDELERKAINWATNMVSSMSIKQVTEGWKEYELKMNSTKTIMASTHEPLEVVNDELEKLNKYADRTIYSFSDMTANIGKFTNSGVKLKEAVKAIQGISNEAALSGANAAEASRAMYNFAQGLSSGFIKLIDWKSIENANMATKEFKEELIKTALEMGTIKELGGQYISAIDGGGKEPVMFDAVHSFNDSLQSAWMTSDVLVATLGKYADETTDLGQRAFKAAQEVNTYTKMIDALKEAVGSGWAQSFEIIFGNLEEATVVWTKVNDVISGFIQGVADTRNGILKLWKVEGRAQVGEALTEIFTNIGNALKYIGLALETLFGHRYWQNFDDLKQLFGDGFSGNLVVIRALSNVLIDLSKHLNTFAKNTKFSESTLIKFYQITQAILVPLQAATRLIEGLSLTVGGFLVKTLLTVAKLIFTVVSDIGESLQAKGGYRKLFDFVDLVVSTYNKMFNKITGNLKWFAKQIGKVFGFNSTIDEVETFSESIMDAIGDAILYVANKAKTLAPILKTIVDALGGFIVFGEKAFIEFLKGAKDFFTNSESGFSKVAAALGRFVEKIKGAFSEGSNFRTLLGKLKEGFLGVVEGIKEFASKIDLGGMFAGLIDGASKMGSDLVSALLNSNGIFDAFKNVGGVILENLQSAFGFVRDRLNIGDLFGNFGETVKKVVDGVVDVFDGIVERLKSIKQLIDKYVDIKGVFNSAKTGAKNFLNSLKKTNKEVNKFGDLFKDLPKNTADFASNVAEIVKENVNWDNVLESVCSYLLEVHDWFNKIKEINVADVFDKIGGKFNTFSEALKNFTTKKPKTELENLETSSKKAGDALDKTKTSVEKVTEGLQNSKVFQTISKSITGLIDLIASVDPVGKFEKLFADLSALFERIQNTKTMQDVVAGFNNVKNAISNIDWSSKESAISGIAAAFKVLVDSLNTIKVDAIDAIQLRLNNLFSIFEEGLNTEDDTLPNSFFLIMLRAVQSGLNGILFGIKTWDWGQVGELLKNFLVFGFLIKAWDSFTTLDKDAKGIVAILGSVKLMVSNMAAMITSTKWQILANAFMTAAKAIAYLALSLLVLSSIPAESLERATVSLGAIILCMTLFTFVRSLFTKYAAKKAEAEAPAKEIKAQGTTLTKSAKIMADALKSIGNEAQRVLKEGFKYAALSMLVTSIGFCVMAIALVAAFLKTNFANPDELATALFELLAIVGLIIVTVGVFGKLSKDLEGGDIAKVAGGLLLLMGAMAIIVGIAYLASQASPDVIKKTLAGLAGIAALTAGMVLGLNLLQSKVDAEGIMDLAKALIIFSLALTALALPLGAFCLLAGNQNFWSAVGGLAALIALGAGIMALTIVMEKFGVSMDSFVQFAGGLLAITVALFVFAKAIEALGNACSVVEDHWQTFLILSIALAALIAVMIIFSDKVGVVFDALGAAAEKFGKGVALFGMGVLMFTQAFKVLAENITLFSSITKEEAEKFTTGLSYLIYGVVKAIIEGILMAIAAVIASLDTFVDSIKDHLPSLVENLLRLIIDTLAAIIAAIIDVIIDFLKWGANKIAEFIPGAGDYILGGMILAVSRIVTAILNFLTGVFQLIPGLGDKIKSAIQNISDKADQAATEMFDRAKATNDAKKAELDKNVEDTTNVTGPVNKSMKENVVAVKAGSEKMGLSVDMLGDMLGDKSIAAFGNLDGSEQASEGLDNTMGVISEKGPQVATLFASTLNPANGADAADDFTSGADMALNFGLNNMVDTTELGMDDITGALDMDTDSIMGDNMQGLNTSMLDNIDLPEGAADKVGSGISTVLGKADMETPAEENVEEVAKTMTDNKGLVEDASRVVASEGANAAGSMSPLYTSVAYNLVKGLADGFEKHKELYLSTVKNVMQESVAVAEKEVQIASPSRKMMWISLMMMKGAAIGIEENAKLMLNAMRDASQDTMATANTELSGDLLSGLGMDYNPVITPVLNTSNIQNGVRSLNGLFNQNMTSSIGANLSVARVDVGSAVGELSSVTNKGNSDLLDALRTQARQTEQLIELLENQKIYLDGNTLVGKTISRIDSSLGQRAILAGRRG